MSVYLDLGPGWSTTGTSPADVLDRAIWPGLFPVIVVLGGAHSYVGLWRWRNEDGSFEQEVVQLR